MLCKVTDVDSLIAQVRDIPEEEKTWIETVKKTGTGHLCSVYIRIIWAYFLPEKIYRICKVM